MAETNTKNDDGALFGDRTPRPVVRSVVDDEGRTLTLRTYPRLPERELDALVGMYDDFDPADRAQGIPPAGVPQIAAWLSGLRDGYHVVASHDGDPVGHAALVPDHDGAYELAIFVHHDYQGAHVGTALLRSLLARADEAGVAVRLHVERSNRPAVALYENLGFETVTTRPCEYTMRRPPADGVWTDTSL
ncbi:GNAT family N-acetyltransferase [Salarchaeum sp. III]|uniref:GNAT family N-acetyltransferase n=1 Tax=Salarchaeum sp. III TaxID=3107927 RepID=UPI002EDB7544